MCISLNKANRIRLIVSSTDISEEAELRLTSMLNETIKNYWVALGRVIFSYSALRLQLRLQNCDDQRYFYRTEELREKY